MAGTHIVLAFVLEVVLDKVVLDDVVSDATEDAVGAPRSVLPPIAPPTEDATRIQMTIALTMMKRRGFIPKIISGGRTDGELASYLGSHRYGF